jgi:hypothetical protein
VSALEIVARARHGKKGTPTREFACSTPGCDKSTRGGNTGKDKLRSAAIHDVEILGYPAGSVCSPCAKDIAIWDEYSHGRAA